MNRTIIDNLRAIAIFAEVVEQGAFRAAARELGLAPSRISETVSALEREFEVTLLNRSTRNLSLTPEGQSLFEQAQAMLSAAERGIDDMGAVSGEPAGELSITMPAFLNGGPLFDRIAEFASAYPKVELKMHFSDRPSNLIEDKFDVAIRAGFLNYSEDRARSLTREDRLLVASPDYLAAREVPEDPGDLANWDWINFMMRPDGFTFATADGRAASVVGHYNIMADSIVAVSSLAKRGLGVTVIPANLAMPAFKAGELVHLLPEWQLPPLGFHAVWSERPRRANLVSVFVEFIARN